MVTGTRLSITLQVHCRSCCNTTFDTFTAVQLRNARGLALTSLGERSPTFRRIVVPEHSRVQRSEIKPLPDRYILQYEGPEILRNVGGC